MYPPHLWSRTQCLHGWNGLMSATESLQTPTFASRSTLLDHTRIPDARSSPHNLWLWAAKACAANRCCGLPQEAPEDPLLCGRGILQVWFYPFISSDVTDGKGKNYLLQNLGQATWQHAVWLLGQGRSLRYRAIGNHLIVFRTSVVIFQWIH